GAEGPFAHASGSDQVVTPVRNPWATPEAKACCLPQDSGRIHHSDYACPLRSASMKRPAPGPNLRLNEISTVWSVVHDPAQFVLRYAPAIERYLAALLPNRHDREE